VTERLSQSKFEEKTLFSARNIFVKITFETRKRNKNTGFIFWSREFQSSRGMLQSRIC